MALYLKPSHPHQSFPKSPASVQWSLKPRFPVLASPGHPLPKWKPGCRFPHSQAHCSSHPPSRESLLDYRRMQALFSPYPSTYRYLLLPLILQGKSCNPFPDFLWLHGQTFPVPWKINPDWPPYFHAEPVCVNQPDP